MTYHGGNLLIVNSAQAIFWGTEWCGSRYYFSPASRLRAMTMR